MLTSLIVSQSAETALLDLDAFGHGQGLEAHHWRIQSPRQDSNVSHWSGRAARTFVRGFQKTLVRRRLICVRAPSKRELEIRSCCSVHWAGVA